MRRSARRRRTVSAYREGDRTVVLIPARMSEAEEQRWVNVMLDKLAAQESKRVLGDAELAERADRLSAQYFEGRARPNSVRWVTNQNTRWGSCTPAEGSIRLSHRLQGMPEYVVDYVLLHELAHLLVPGHGPRFWQLMDAYPRTERARGYLEGVVARFGRSYTGEPDVLAEELAKDAAVQAADTVLLTVPNQLGVEYNARLLGTIAQEIAPSFGWQPKPRGA